MYSREHPRQLWGAVFSLFITIAFKLLPTVEADQVVVGLFVHLILVAVPKCHAALIRTELLFLSSFGLFQRFTALHTHGRLRLCRVSAEVAFNSIGRKTNNICNSFISESLKCKATDLVLYL